MLLFSQRFRCAFDYLGLNLMGQRSAGVFAARRLRKRRRMRWHLQHWIGASQVYQGQNEAKSWWHCNAPPPGGWHWGRYHNQRGAAGRERQSKQETKSILNRYCFFKAELHNLIFFLRKPPWLFWKETLLPRYFLSWKVHTVLPHLQSESQRAWSSLQEALYNVWNISMAFGRNNILYIKV